MQGEADARRIESAAAYEANLDALIAAARRDFDHSRLPFVAGRINPPQEKFPFVDEVRRAQERVDVEHYELVDCDDLPKLADQVHYNGTGLVELGNRFAAAVAKLTSVQDRTDDL